MLAVQSLTYKTDAKTLIDNISLEFTAGSLHAVLGPNGSGKSTLLKTLSGIWKAASGCVLWNGIPLLSQERKQISRIVSLVPQNPHVHFDFTVEDMVAMGRYAHQAHYWDTINEQQMKDVLTTVDAWDLRSRRVDCLSQGERQRVYIARALMTQAPVLLLDEPTASLDIRHQNDIWQLLQNLASHGKVVIVTTHDLAVVKNYCHSVAVLNQGKCIGHGPFSSLITPDLLHTVFGATQFV